jgi:t-SNARE complex subunit (syntaxin)
MLKSLSKKQLLLPKASVEKSMQDLKVACLKREVALLDQPPSSGEHKGEEELMKNAEMRGEFELSLQAGGKEAENLEMFFAGMEGLREVMRKVKSTTRQLRDLHDQSFDPKISKEEKAGVRTMFNKLMNKNEALLESVRKKTLELKGVELTSDAFSKLKHNLLNGANMKSAKLLLDYKTVLRDHDTLLKEETWREMKEARLDESGDAVREDIEAAGERSMPFDPRAEQVGDFMQKFVFREKAAHAKQYLEEKHRDLEIIERNLTELNELMKDFAVMVESANEPLEQIDTYMRSTKANMAVVEENLRQAKYKVLGMRKKKLYTALGVVAVVVVVVAVVVGIVCLL